MQKILGMTLMVVGLCSAAFAGRIGAVPEIDATTAVSALTLISGATLVIRARKR